MSTLTLKQLKARQEKLKTELNSVYAEIEQEQIRKVYPSLQDKYIGYWFKKVYKDTFTNTICYYKPLEIKGFTTCSALTVTATFDRKKKRVEGIAITFSQHEYFSMLGKLCEQVEVEDVIREFIKTTAEYLSLEEK